MPNMDDDRGDGREDGAFFEPAQVRTSRGQRFLAVGVAFALCALVGLGAINRMLTPDETSSNRATVGPAVAQAQPKQEPSQRFTNGPEIIGPPTQPPEIVALDLKPAGSDLFVHGDLFSLAVVRVSVELEDSHGSAVAATESVKIPGGSTAFRLGAVPRFDVQFNVPDGLMGEGIWIAVTAYGNAGRTLAIVRQLVPGASDST